MPTSGRFREMRSRLHELRRHMLPNPFSPTGDYTDRQLDRARGYRLLVHAEIESYLEDISRDTVTSSINKWKVNGTASAVLISFLASYHSSWNFGGEVSREQVIQIAKSRKNMKDSVNEIIDLAQTQFIQRIKDNHGIRDKNFKVLILPTAVDIEKLDPTWLTNLDNFGTKRGEVAHKTKKATEGISPKDEYETVKGLLKGLEYLDRMICDLK